MASQWMAAEVCPELFQSVRFRSFKRRTVRDHTTDSSSFEFQHRAGAVSVSRSSPFLMPDSLRAYPKLSGPVQCSLLSAFHRGLILVGSPLFLCASWSSPEVLSYPLARVSFILRVFAFGV
jgi:hypothetical protein